MLLLFVAVVATLHSAEGKKLCNKDSKATDLGRETIRHVLRAQLATPFAFPSRERGKREKKPAIQQISFRRCNDLTQGRTQRERE